MKKNKNNRESGYALLLIFSMAAIVAIMLYSQVPKVEFEAQRDKEQLLIDRGNQYSRAVALFVRKYNRFPATFEELENTNGLRFLRRRYVDPMTGKADWRLLHAGPGGVIADSILNKSTASGSGSSVNDFITEMKMFGENATGGDSGEGINLAKRLRPSDQQGGAGDMSGIGNDPTAAPVPVMVLPNGTIVPATTSGTYQPAPQQPGQQPIGSPGAQGFSGPPLPTGVAIQQNGQNGQNPPPVPPQLGGPPNSAANLINQLLTTPRPGGMNGMNGVQGAAPGGITPGTSATGAAAAGGSTSGQQVIGAGLAGVASKREQEGIKTVNERKKYNEWEFVYDITKEKSKAQAAGAAGASGGQSRPGASGLTTPPTSGGAPSTPTTSAPTTSP